jgi:hypothetical protein
MANTSLFKSFARWLGLLSSSSLLAVSVQAAELPQLVTQNGKHALMVDGAPVRKLITPATIPPHLKMCGRQWKKWEPTP